MQLALGHEAAQLILIIHIGVGVRPKEQPVITCTLLPGTFLEKAAEGRQASAAGDHHDWPGGLLWQCEARRMNQLDRDALAGGGLSRARQKAGASAEAHA